jgi:hypothetical protein
VVGHQPAVEREERHAEGERSHVEQPGGGERFGGHPLRRP